MGVAVRNVKKGEFFTKKAISNPAPHQVWVRGKYDRKLKRYMIYNFADVCYDGTMPADREVFTDFIF